MTAILDSITDVMMVLDEDLRILSVNSVFEELFPNRNTLGEHCYKIFTCHDYPCTVCPAFRSLRRNRVYRESAIFQINNSNMHFDMVASPLPHPAGQGRAVLMLKRDVTLEKRLQAQMYQSGKMASIGTLAAGIAHEINNPLTAIAGFAEGIGRRLPKLPDNVPQELAEDLAEYAEIIIRETSRCRDIVEALLNFSRPMPSRAPVCLSAMVIEAISLLRHKLKSREQVVFCLDFAPDLPDIWADDTQVRQLVLNLVTNALDALEVDEESSSEQKEEKITVRAFKEKDAVVLEVEDTGAGVDSEHLDTVFEPFFTTKPKGMGLGLSVCYSVVQAHGGDIAMSRSGGVTCVTVRLPLQKEPGEQAERIALPLF